MAELRNPWHWLPLVVLALSCSACGPSKDSHFEAVARYWSPIIEQYQTWPDFKNDNLTRVDFDGDWNLDNNRSSSARMHMSSHIYYWVVESKTHYFIGYGFYHVGTEINSEVPVGNLQFQTSNVGNRIENQFQGLLTTVQKSNDVDLPFGSFVSMVIWSGGKYTTWIEADQEDRLSAGLLRAAATAEVTSGSPGALATDKLPELAALWKAHTRPSRHVIAGSRPIAGDLNFLVDDIGFHPTIGITADVHQIRGGRTQYVGGLDEAVPWVFDWRGLDFSRSKMVAGLNRGWLMGQPHWGVVYHYEDNADSTRRGKGKGHGKGAQNHHFEVIGYTLVPMTELWERRVKIAPEQIVFVEDGMLAGKGPRTVLSSLPWAWTESPSSLGDANIFLSPGNVVASLFSGLDAFSPEPIGASFATARELGKVKPAAPKFEPMEANVELTRPEAAIGDAPEPVGSPSPATHVKIGMD